MQILLISWLFFCFSVVQAGFEFRPGLVVNGFETDSLPADLSSIADSVQFLDNSRAFKFPGFGCRLKLIADTLHREMGLRFDFGLDTVGITGKLKWAENVSLRDTNFRIFSVVTQDRETGPYTDYLLDLIARKRGDAWHLLIALNSLGNGPVLAQKDLGPLENGRGYGTELLLGLDSVSRIITVQFLLDGRKVFEKVLGEQGISIPKIQFWFGSIEHANKFTGTLFVDNVAFGRGWRPAVPSRPSISGPSKRFSRVTGDSIFLVSPAFDPGRASSGHLFSQYQIQFQKGNWRFPLYDSDLEKKFRDTLRIKMPLSPGNQYFWRVRHWSSDSMVSDWSRPESLLLSAASGAEAVERLPAILGVRISLPGTNLPLDTLVKGRVYDLVIKAASARGFSDMGYAIFWANRPEYPSGNMRNRGGAFLPASSYVVNLSVDPKGVYEKREPGLYRTTRLDGKTGLFADDSAGAFRVKPSDSTLWVRIRFPAAALPGTWCLRGFVRAAGEIASPLHYSLFTLVEEKPRTAPDRDGAGRALLIIGLMIAVLAGIGWGVRNYRKRLSAEITVIQSREQELFGKLDVFIRANLSKEIAITDLETHMSMSYSSIHRLMKAADKGSVKVYIHAVKMEKAQELLRTTNLSIAEIMGMVGFNDAAYFSKIFRKFADLSPRQYREKHQKLA